MTIIGVDLLCCIRVGFTKNCHVTYACKKTFPRALVTQNLNVEGKWTAEEEQRLSGAVHELSSSTSGEFITAGISWAAVAERVSTRSEKQCRSKW